ncbi:MAG: hypothetical protein ACLUIQ_05510 [Dialister invisus]
MQRNDLDKNVMANGGSGYTLHNDGRLDVKAGRFHTAGILLAGRYHGAL